MSSQASNAQPSEERIKDALKDRTRTRNPPSFASRSFIQRFLLARIAEVRLLIASGSRRQEISSHRCPAPLDRQLRTFLRQPPAKQTSPRLCDSFHPIACILRGSYTDKASLLTPRCQIHGILFCVLWSLINKPARPFSNNSSALASAELPPAWHIGRPP